MGDFRRSRCCWLVVFESPNRSVAPRNVSRGARSLCGIARNASLRPCLAIRTNGFGCSGRSGLRPE